MPELEEVGERAATQVSRSQNLVYTLPHTTESIAEFLTPALARVDPSAGGTIRRLSSARPFASTRSGNGVRPKP